MRKIGKTSLETKVRENHSKQISGRMGSQTQVLWLLVQPGSLIWGASPRQRRQSLGLWECTVRLQTRFWLLVEFFVASGCCVYASNCRVYHCQPLCLPPPAVIRSSQLLCHHLQPGHFVLRGGQTQKQINNQHTPPPSCPGLWGKKASQSSQSGLLLPYQKPHIPFPLEGAISPKQSQPGSGIGTLQNTLNSEAEWGYLPPLPCQKWANSFPKGQWGSFLQQVPIFCFTPLASPKAGFPYLQALLCQWLVLQNQWIYQSLSQVLDCSRDKTVLVTKIGQDPPLFWG